MSFISLVHRRFAMQEKQTPPLIPTACNFGLEFAPPMVTSNTKSHNPTIAESEGSVADDVTPPRKRRQVSLESRMETFCSPESSPNTPSSSSTSATTQQPQASEDMDDRTSKDYYFDSYSHHAIRKCLCLRCIRLRSFPRAKLTFFFSIL